jgi:hypothetical protein
MFLFLLFQVTPNESPPSIDENKTQPNGHLVQIDENVESKFDRMNNVIHKDVEPSKEWLASNRDNVSNWGDMSIDRLLFQ